MVQQPDCNQTSLIPNQNSYAILMFSMQLKNVLKLYKLGGFLHILDESVRNPTLILVLGVGKEYIVYHN